MPVVASDGHSYERDAIEHVMANALRAGASAVSPLTRQVLSGELIENFALRRRIEEHDGELLRITERLEEKQRQAEESVQARVAAAEAAVREAQAATTAAQAAKAAADERAAGLNEQLEYALHAYASPCIGSVGSSSSSGGAPPSGSSARSTGAGKRHASADPKEEEEEEGLPSTQAVTRRKSKR